MWRYETRIPELGPVAVTWDDGALYCEPSTVARDLAAMLTRWLTAVADAGLMVGATATGPWQTPSLGESHVAFATIRWWLEDDLGATGGDVTGDGWRWPVAPIPEGAVA